MQRHDVASTLIQCCLNVACPQGKQYNFKESTLSKLFFVPTEKGLRIFYSWEQIISFQGIDISVFGLGLASQAEGQSSYSKISTPAKAFTEKPESKCQVR